MPAGQDTNTKNKNQTTLSLEDQLAEEQLKREEAEGKLKKLEADAKKKEEETDTRFKLLEKMILKGPEIQQEPDADDGSARVFQGHRKVFHDLHCLLPAKSRQDQGWKGNQIIVEHDHQHWFHSNDSDGRPQKWSGPQAGHIHEVTWEMMEIEKDVNGETVTRKVPRITFVGPPMKRISVKGRKYPFDPKGKLRLSESEDDQGDRHTHRPEYHESKEVTVRRKNQKLSVDAQKAQDTMMQRNAEDAGAQKAFLNAGGKEGNN